MRSEGLGTCAEGFASDSETLAVDADSFAATSAALLDGSETLAESEDVSRLVSSAEDNAVVLGPELRVTPGKIQPQKTVMQTVHVIPFSL